MSLLFSLGMNVAKREAKDRDHLLSVSSQGKNQHHQLGIVTKPFLARSTQLEPLESRLCWGILLSSQALETAWGVGSEPTVGLMLPPPWEHWGCSALMLGTDACRGPPPRPECVPPTPGDALLPPAGSGPRPWAV